MPVTAASAPARQKADRFEIVEVIISATFIGAVVVVSDASGNRIARYTLLHRGATWDKLEFAADGSVFESTVTATGTGAQDFTAFTGAAGNFAAKAAALEARYQATGRIPS